MQITILRHFSLNPEFLRQLHLVLSLTHRVFLFSSSFFLIYSRILQFLLHIHSDTFSVNWFLTKISLLTESCSRLPWLSMWLSTCPLPLIFFHWRVRMLLHQTPEVQKLWPPGHMLPRYKIMTSWSYAFPEQFYPLFLFFSGTAFCELQSNLCNSKSSLLPDALPSFSTELSPLGISAVLSSRTHWALLL